MAALTATNVYRHSMGDLTLHIVDLPATSDSADTYTSGIQGIISVMATQADASGTQTSTGVGAALTTAATGVVTVYAAEDNTAITLWIVSKS